MLLLQASRGLLEVFIGLLAQTRLGLVGVALLFLIGVGIRARHSGVAVGAVVVLALLMTQA
ncbi:hypothetical protein [Streptomyces chromofuscus]|uniref:Uncharacterized protein n=1 Tax=Streptomyces chromofuscus TaxID=42881 RepID=A0A7M2T1J7_STRCW|nr:hypothetical protein [Streptomyces chromofuscus]QOV41648.1 hypothetical protein IPT68_17035 [Streptomyces chromofuscus]GGT39083.1 hypothetical protein GCM10010254_68970 [Streptomyces chromofuscus]